MVHLDIVYPDVGRTYRTDAETVVGVAVDGAAQWHFPLSLHYHYALLDRAIVRRYVTRASTARARPTPPAPQQPWQAQQKRQPQQAPPAAVGGPRLVFAPPEVQGPTPAPVPSPVPAPSPPASASPAVPTPSPPPPPSPPSSRPPTSTSADNVVLDEHYAPAFILPEAPDDPGWVLVDDAVTSDDAQEAQEAQEAQDEADAHQEEPAIVVPSPAARVAVPTVSVVMTTYNCVKYLEHAVRSLQSQTLTNWELIVVDDRSTDGTDVQLRALAEEDDRIVYLHNRHNVGCYAAKNTAIAYARGEWLTFHDADDHSMSERLEKQLWYCVTGESDRRGRTRARGAHPPPSAADRGYDACYVTSLARKQKVWAWLPITLFLPLRLFREKLGAYDTVRFGADSELRKRLHSLRLRVGILEDYLYACPDRWIELSTRTTSLTGDPTKEPIRELYTKGYVGLHRPLQQAPALTEAEARLLRYPFPPFKRQDVCTRTHPFVIPGLTAAQAERLFPSTEAIRENLALNRSGEPPPPTPW